MRVLPLKRVAAMCRSDATVLSPANLLDRMVKSTEIATERKKVQESLDDSGWCCRHAVSKRFSRSELP